MSYAKFAGPAPRILILRSQYWLDGACINAARGMGWEVETAQVLMEGRMARDLIETLLRKLTAFRPDFILSINLAGMDVDGLFARLFEDLQIPYVAWFVDDPRTMLMGRTCYATDYSVALTWDRAYVPYLRDCGFPEVHAVPLAVDATVFNAEPADNWPNPPTFVGNSMVDFSKREQQWLDDHPGLCEAVASAFAAGRVTRKNFGYGIEAVLGVETVAELDAEAVRHAEMVFFIEGTRQLRHELAEALVPLGLELRGDPGWQRAFPEAKGPLNYVEELPTFYRACPVNLNVTSIQMPHTVNQRVFDCPAAGGFLLTDAQRDLEDLFDVETEVAQYHDVGECISLLQEYLAHAKARSAITIRARKRILGEHTYAHRLERIVAIVRERFSA